MGNGQGAYAAGKDGRRYPKWVRSVASHMIGGPVIVAGDKKRAVGGQASRFTRASWPLDEAVKSDWTVGCRCAGRPPFRVGHDRPQRPAKRQIVLRIHE